MRLWMLKLLGMRCATRSYCDANFCFLCYASTSRVTAIIMFLILDSPLVIVSVSVTTCCHFVTTGALKPFVAPNTVGNSVCLLEGWRLHLWKVGWILFCIGGDCSSAALSVSLVGSILELAGISLWNSFKWCIRRSFNQSTFFMEIFTIAAWEIWKQRNNFIFNRGRPSFVS